MEHEILEHVQEEIQKFKSENLTRLANISKLSAMLADACHIIERSWSGSFAGYHGRLYYGNFEVPPVDRQFSVEWGGLYGIDEGWQERSPEEVSAEIERLVGHDLSVKELEEAIKDIRGKAEDLRTEIVISFSSFPFSSDMGKEKELSSQIENFTFGEQKEAYIKRNLPGGMATRDANAIMQGMCIPSHLYYDSVAFEGKSICNAIQDFLRLSDRTIRQMEIKTEVKTQTIQNSRPQTSQDILFIERICKRFHIVVNQLRERHQNRHTLDVSDEYDVQDLLHALLRIFFDDIRPEEWTPSYAGKSARMDFLLKNESIVIEVKKTRDGLSSREVGSQLIEDIHRYSNSRNRIKPSNHRDIPVAFS
jgi:hypothetical protein